MELNQSSYFPIDIDIVNSQRIQKRTQLKKVLIVGLILGSICILGFFIHTIRIEIINRSACDTPDCVIVAGQILSQVDKDIDPCEDFFLFACGKAKNVTSKEHHPRRLLKSNIEKQLQNLLEEPIDENDHSIFNYEKEFHRACLADKNGTQSLETLKQMFNDLNGWPVVVGSKWDENNFNWIDWVPKFHKFGLNHVQILRYFVTLDSVDPTKQIVTIYPPSMYISETSRDKQRKILKDVAIMFGADESNTDLEIDRVMEFMWNIMEIRRKHINYTHDEPTRARVSEFQKVHEELNWLHYLNLLTEPEYTIKVDDYLTFWYSDCVKTVLDFVQRSEKRTVANYMFWCAANDLLSVITNENFEMYGNRKTRTDICRNIIRQNFSPLSSFVAYGKRYLTTESRRQATDIFNRVKNEFKRLFNNNKWMIEEDKQKFRHKFDTMNEIIGIQDHTMNYSVYHNFFKTRLTPQDRFLKMYLNLKTTMNFISTGVAPKEEWMDNVMFFGFMLDTETFYFGTQNTIMLPVGALYDWYYHKDRPMYVNFATIGKNIGVTFAKVITSIDVSAKEKIIWSEETKKGYEEATSCIDLKNIDNVMTEFYDYKILELGQIVGLKVAHNAYIGWVEDNEEELPARGTGYSARQLFWISALTSSCFEDIYDFNFFIDNEPVKRNPDFALDFSCNDNSKMNPSEKCNLL
ncbi:hypothetical protein RI129_003906 [Pyrocoelia pectoralis]|uniref:Neprilysin n=1 Tax=Pyrocoelia pectoralis TaxID=417401 RepID=A0AAN7VQF4_9COLE